MNDTITYDAAVVGIGAQGLIAACLLAKQNARVCVLDAPTGASGGNPYDVFGGGARSGPVAHMPLPVSKKIADYLDLESRGFTVRPAQTCSFAPTGTDRGDYIFTSSNRAATLRELEKFSATDAAAFLNLADDAAKLANLLDQVAGTLPPYDQNGWKDLWAVFETGRLLAGGGADMQARFVQLLTGSLDKVLDANFTNDAIKGFLAAQATVASLTPTNRKGSAAAFVQALLGLPGGAQPYTHNWQPIRGNLHELLKALTQTALDLGVTFFPGNTLKSLYLANGQIDGALMADNTKLRARQFIADCNPLVLFDRVMSDVPPSFAVKLKPLRESAGFVRLKLLVNELPRFGCLSGQGDESFLSGDITIAPSLDYLTKARLELRGDGIPVLPALSAVIPTVISPELAPNGKHVVSIVAQPFAAGLLDTPETRNNVATAVVRTMEVVASGFQNSIEAIAVYMEDNLNHTMGPLNRASLGDGHPLVQLFAANFGHHGLGYDLPYANLVMCGYGAESSASPHVNRGGENAAVTVMKALG